MPDVPGQLGNASGDRTASESSRGRSFGELITDFGPVASLPVDHALELDFELLFQTGWIFTRNSPDPNLFAYFFEQLLDIRCVHTPILGQGLAVVS